MVKKTIKVLWFNEYSGLKITYNDVSLVLDPCQAPYSTIGEIKYILISHEHADHLDIRLVNDLSRYSLMVLADTESGSRLKKYVPRERLRLMRPGDVFKDSNVNITAFKSVHPAVNPVTYLIEYSDETRIFYASDSLVAGEHSQIAKLSVDLIFVPIGIAPGASPKSASEMVHIIQPKVAIPVHGTRFNDFRSLVEAKDPKVRVQIIPKDIETVVEV
jgi:L-ascorbate metabolism protein UlaG (beta-lactamase superfamily)